MTDPRYERMNAIVDDVKATLFRKGNLYRREPATFVDLELLDNMIILKGYRARESLTSTKRLDEYRDILCYTLLAMEREMAENGDIPPPEAVLEAEEPTV